ncbi:recombinase family protein [Lysinibacillus fusiformis]|uniref:Site-specific DNA recombinase n=1 Tax=Lysinibacillus fusiformis TaxID=28031 RepID=A0A1H9JJF4_9BACI|nr:recombinase family protein [Lysinibacillus fusiformis]SCY43195.1 Site-specific DNA recombinase [Lysinibacillus fusiformis]SEN74883.1 Site-specific DNA recombinase [Lysinibacillus fusiformis]SEQ86927.1 Site-specific DNA recombinase [Lysinibacillus fusiformis]
MGRVIGYCRVSTEDQNLDMQKQAIEYYAKEKELELILYVEKISSRKEERVELEHAMKAATNGDLFVVYKLDRLARSTKELFTLTGELQEKGVEFVSINDAFDTTTPTGKAMFGMLAVFAEFERDIIQQRTKAGLESARKRGRIGGRPSIDEKTKKKVRALFEAGESATDVAKEYGIGRATVYKIIKNN